MKDGQLTCAYHALHFNYEGKCTRIPAHPDIKIAGKMCLTTYPVVERYNIIWTCLNPDSETLNPLPEWDDINDPGVDVLRIPSPTWKVSAARHCENFHDPAHFSVVHEGTFGSSEYSEVPPYKVVRTETGLEHTNIFKQVDRNTFDVGEDEIADIKYNYKFTFPFCNHLYLESESENFDWYTVVAVASPNSSRESRIFLQIIREKKTDQEQSANDVIEFEKAIVQQDLAVVEYLEPLELSLDLSDEVLIPADAWSIAYRRALADFGLTTGMEQKN